VNAKYIDYEWFVLPVYTYNIPISVPIVIEINLQVSKELHVKHFKALAR